MSQVEGSPSSSLSSHINAHRERHANMLSDAETLTISLAVDVPEVVLVDGLGALGIGHYGLKGVLVSTRRRRAHDGLFVTRSHCYFL